MFTLHEVCVCVRVCVCVCVCVCVYLSYALSVWALVLVLACLSYLSVVRYKNIYKKTRGLAVSFSFEPNFFSFLFFPYTHAYIRFVATVIIMCSIYIPWGATEMCS